MAVARDIVNKVGQQATESESEGLVCCTSQLLLAGSENAEGRWLLESFSRCFQALSLFAETFK